MREGRTKRKLGEVITLEYGKPLPSDQRCEHQGFPAYGANGIKCFSAKPYCNEPSIIVGRKGTAGAVNLVDGGFWPLDVTYYVTFDKTHHDLKFLYYMLSALDLPSLATGVKPGINRNAVYAIEQCFPPLPEQNRIVAILDEAFVGIATAVANTEKNLANARELFESYLNAVVNRRGEGWSKSKIGDLVDLHQGLAINKGTKHLLVESGGLPLLRIKDLRNGNAEQFVASEGWPKNAKVGVDEIIYTRTGQIGLVFRGREGVLHNNCFKVVSKGKLSTGYLYWLLQGPDFRKAVIKLASRAAQPDITHKLFKEQTVSLPPAHFQDMAVPKIESLYGDVTTVRDIYHRKLDALSELKQSLLQKAFSGELTAVPQDEIETVLA